MNFLASLLLAFALAPQLPSGAQSPAAQPPGTPGTQPPATQTPPQAPPTANPGQPPAPTAPRGYVIGPQDLLTIRVFDNDDLTNKYRVDTDGSISFPLVGRIVASGLTLGELQDRLTRALAAGYLRHPQVQVDIEEYKSQSVIVSGEVRTPGEIKMGAGAMTLLRALALAGSPTSAASNELTVAHRPRMTLTSGAEIIASAEVITVNWNDISLGKIADVPLQDGDIINVPKAEIFYIQGYVRNTGNYVLERGMTVAQALARAGGLSERGTYRGMSAGRLVNGKLTDVPIKLEDRVQPNDVITVKQRMF